MQGGIFIVWKGYQRRAEIIAPKLKSEILWIPHRFRRKLFRPIDYLYKLFISYRLCWQRQPNFIVAQSPPLYSALAAWLLQIPYILDAHNPVFQDVGGKVMWGKLPLSDFLIRQATAVIVHNHGILQLAQTAYPQVTFFNIPDPIATIASRIQRNDRQILVICSFDPDEPIEILLSSMAQLPEYTFIITADILKLPHPHQVQLQNLPNVRLTGFLPIQEYHAYLCSSTAALVLTSQDLIQPSGACEALSSNTPLIISNTPLIRELFGDWAILVENTVPAIVNSLRQFHPEAIDLRHHRNLWNQSVDREIEKMMDFLLPDRHSHQPPR
jgi:glycosyltransferase involved in cell wall biosynthesis